MFYSAGLKQEANSSNFPRWGSWHKCAFNIESFNLRDSPCLLCFRYPSSTNLLAVLFCRPELRPEEQYYETERAEAKLQLYMHDSLGSVNVQFSHRDQRLHPNNCELHHCIFVNSPIREGSIRSSSALWTVPSIQTRMAKYSIIRTFTLHLNDNFVCLHKHVLSPQATPCRKKAAAIRGKLT